MEKIEDVIELLEAVKGFRVNDELPFGTVDYMQIDSAIEFLRRLTKRSPDARSALRVPCTCGQDDGLHEWDCAISRARR